MCAPDMKMIILISVILAHVKISRHIHALWDGPFCQISRSKVQDEYFPRYFTESFHSSMFHVFKILILILQWHKKKSELYFLGLTYLILVSVLQVHALSNYSCTNRNVSFSVVYTLGKDLWGVSVEGYKNCSCLLSNFSVRWPEGGAFNHRCAKRERKYEYKLHKHISAVNNRGIRRVWWVSLSQTRSKKRPP